MTKTGAPVSVHLLGNLYLCLMMVLNLAEVNRFGICYLGHWDLFEIWDLVLGIFIVGPIG